MHGYVNVAVTEGATLLTGGGRSAGFDRGYYVDPIALLSPDAGARICQEEVFGPFATIAPFDTLEDALRIVNRSPFGLVSYVWSSRLSEAMRCSRDIRAGVVRVNTPMMRELRAPFGGYKESGVGRDGATTIAEFFTDYKTTSIPIDPVDPVAMPRLGLGVGR